MKTIKTFKIGDELPDSAKYIDCAMLEDGVTFYYEVKIKKEAKKTVSKAADYFDPDEFVLNVVEYLNAVLKRNFKPTGKLKQLILDRVKTDDAIFDDFKACIDNMHEAWSNDPKMAQYLRPITLFSASKFSGYVNHTSSAHEAAEAFNELEEYMK